MLRNFLLLLLCGFMVVVSGYHKSALSRQNLKVSRRGGELLMSAKSHESMKKKIIGSILASAIGFSIHNDGFPTTFPSIVVPSAHADVRAQQKSTFFRFSPKLIEGKQYFRDDLKKAIDQEKWEDVKKFFEVYASKVNKNDPKQIDAYDSYPNNHFYRPMKVLAGSYAERGSSTKQRLLLEQETAFEAAMADLEGCVNDRKGEGFFAPTIKAPTGKERTAQAKIAWEKANTALNAYITILNDGLMLELNKIPL